MKMSLYFSAHTEKQLDGTLVGGTLIYDWVPALRFRSSVQIGSSSIFPFPFGTRYGNGATVM